MAQKQGKVLCPDCWVRLHRDLGYCPVDVHVLDLKDSGRCESIRHNKPLPPFPFQPSDGASGWRTARSG